MDWQDVEFRERQTLLPQPRHLVWHIRDPERPRDHRQRPDGRGAGLQPAIERARGDCERSRRDFRAHQ